MVWLCERIIEEDGLVQKVAIIGAILFTIITFMIGIVAFGTFIAGLLVFTFGSILLEFIFRKLVQWSLW